MKLNLLFACVFAELLAQRKDPSQYVYHQDIIRDDLDNFKRTKNYYGSTGKMFESRVPTLMFNILRFYPIFCEGII